MLILGVIVVVLLLAGYAAWVLWQTSKSICPTCHKNGEDAPLFPIFGNLRWWCLNCGEFQDSRLLRANPGKRFREIREAESQKVSKKVSGLRRSPKVDEDDEPAAPTF